MLTIRDIIRKAGGASAIAAESAKTAKPVKRSAVFKWMHLGVHHDHWHLLVSMADVTIAEIYDANRQLERPKRRNPPRRRSKSGAAVAA